MRFLPVGRTVARFATAAALLLLAPLLTAEAQQAGKVYRIGFLSSLPVPATALTNSLQNVGLVEGQNVVIDRRLTDAPEELARLAEEIVRHQPDVIVAYWNRDVIAAQEATRSIPIVMIIGVDPVGAELWRAWHAPVET